MKSFAFVVSVGEIVLFFLGILSAGSVIFLCKCRGTQTFSS